MLTYFWIWIWFFGQINIHKDLGGVDDTTESDSAVSLSLMRAISAVSQASQSQTQLCQWHSTVYSRIRMIFLNVKIATKYFQNIELLHKIIYPWVDYFYLKTFEQ